MNETLKAVAKAVVHAQAAHKESWNGTKPTLDWGVCFEAACKVCDAPKEFAHLLYLANTWRDETRTWAEDVLSEETESVDTRPTQS